MLEHLLNGRLPRLVPWLPAIGVAVGLGVGVGVWLVADIEWLIVREAAIAAGAVAGLAIGLVARTRVGRRLAAIAARLDAPAPPTDLPAEFRPERPPIDHATDAFRGHIRY